MYKAILLPILLLCSVALTEHATNERLSMVLSNAIESRMLAVPVTEPNMDSLEISRDYFSNIRNNLKMLQSFSELEAVRDNSGAPVEGIIDSVIFMIDMTPLYDQLLADFDEFFVIVEKHGIKSPEAQEISQEIAKYYFGLFAPPPDAQGLERIQSLLLQLQK